MRRLIAATALLLLTGCGAGGAAGTGDRNEVAGTLTVLAAASLTEVFPELGARLEAQHPGLEVRLAFAGSSTLATQITQGAPADVFASANLAQMRVVTEAGLTEGDPAVFTTNFLEIAVPAGNPADVAGLADFEREELALAICAPEVPCGSAAEQVFTSAGVAARPDTLEDDVRAALTKVELGEVDAALVYATDVTASSDAVEGIDFPEAEEAVTEYPISVIMEAPNPRAARAFVALVRSAEGQRVLAEAGFREP